MSSLRSRPVVAAGDDSGFDSCRDAWDDTSLSTMDSKVTYAARVATRAARERRRDADRSLVERARRDQPLRDRL